MSPSNYALQYLFLPCGCDTGKYQYWWLCGGRGVVLIMLSLSSHTLSTAESRSSISEPYFFSCKITPLCPKLAAVFQLGQSCCPMSHPFCPECPGWGWGQGERCLTELGVKPIFASMYVSVFGSTASSASKIFSTGMSSLALLVDSTSFSLRSFPRCRSSWTAGSGQRRDSISLGLPVTVSQAEEGH